MIRSILVILVSSALAAAQVQLQFPYSSANYTRLVPLPGGTALLVGTKNQKIALFPPPYYPKLGGSGNDVPRDAAIDPNGNIWIVGNTTSDDFNLVNPIVAQKIPYRTAGFVIELDPTETTVLFATYLGGQQRSPYPYASYATAVTIDSSGNVYVGGSTNETDFPTTPGAFLGGKGGADAFYNTYYYSYVLKISPSGKQVYSTELRTGTSDCQGGSGCIGRESTSATVSALFVDPAGAATVAGELGGGNNPGGGYVLKLAPDGSKPLWSNTLDVGWGAVTSLFMAPDLTLFGTYAPVVIAAQPYVLGTPGLFAAKLEADGSGFAYMVDLGQSAGAHAYGIAVSASGDAYVAGNDFVEALDPAGSPMQPELHLPAGTVIAPPVFDSKGDLLLLGAQGSLLTIPPGYALDSPAIVGFSNSASLAPNTGLYPGALVTLFGFDLPINSQGVQVLFSGTPGALLFVGPTQINVQVPFDSATFGSVQVEVVLPSGTISFQAPVSQTIGLFPAALNQDGTVNSVTNPAPAGSIVSLFGTGAIWPSGLPDGAIASAAMPLDQSQNRFEALYSSQIPLNVLYAGAAPGLVSSVFQVNVQLLPNTPSGYQPTLTLQSGSLLSNAVGLYIKD